MIIWLVAFYNKHISWNLSVEKLWLIPKACEVLLLLLSRFLQSCQIEKMRRMLKHPSYRSQSQDQLNAKLILSQNAVFFRLLAGFMTISCSIIRCVHLQRLLCVEVRSWLTDSAMHFSQSVIYIFFRVTRVPCWINVYVNILVGMIIAWVTPVLVHIKIYVTS